MSRRSPLCALLPAAFLLLAACGGGGNPPAPSPSPTPEPTPSPLAPPRHAAQIGVDAVTGDTATVFRFFGQGSDATGGAVAYAWDFDGDDVTDATEPSPTHTFAAPGSPTVRLRVTDGEGRAHVADAVVGVYDVPTSAPPAVTLHAWTLHGAVPCEVLLRATAVDPDGGSIVGYAWDYDNDGTIDETGVSPTTVTTVFAAGVLTLRVSVVDDEGAHSDATVTIVLCAGGAYPDGAPTAMIDVPSGSLLVATATPLELVAVGSDLDGGPLGAADWDLDDDGVFDDATGRVISPTFGTEGVRRIRVRLTDEEGEAPSEAEVHVLVQDTPGPAAPSAWAFAEALTTSPQTVVQFHARAQDPEAEALTFAWDLDGDGLVDSTLADPAYAFQLPGVYRPRLQVQDASGNTTTSELTVLVERCGDPPLTGWRYACADVLLLHGGTFDLPLLPVGTTGGAPTTYALLTKVGPPGEDPAALGLGVTDHTGQSLPGPINPVAVPAGGTVPLSLVATGIDGPPRVTRYTVGVRLVEAGVRVQILTCQVAVVHDVVQADLFDIPLTDAYQGLLRVWVDTTPFAALPGALPGIYEVELVFADMTPDIVAFLPLGSAFLQPGWEQGALTGGHRFYTTTDPVPATGAMHSWQFQYDTALGAGVGPLLTAGRVRLRDLAGNLVGIQDLLLR